MSTEQSISENQAKSDRGALFQRLHLAFRLPHPTLSKNAMATENLLILWNPRAPKGMQTRKTLLHWIHHENKLGIESSSDISLWISAPQSFFLRCISV